MADTEQERSRIRYLPMYGCVSTGVIYLAIGSIAMLSFLQYRDGGADESSMLAILNDFTIGKIFIWIILLGTLSYIVWRVYESIADPYEYGGSTKGIMRRIGIGLSASADALIAYAAIRVLLGTNDIQKSGQPTEEREMVAALLQEPYGRWLITGIGIVVMITAIIQFVYGYTSGYKERGDMKHYRKLIQTTIHILARIGYSARGIIIGIIGFFFIRAGLTENARHIVNTDKAFDFIGDEVGHVYFVLVALGTMCYGLFMFALGSTYSASKK
jgi:hypothetical protein